jgi:hypothetical protein
MRNRFSYFILATVFAIFAAIAAVEYMTEYTNTGKCYRTNSILSAEEMRARVIRSLLISEMQSAARRNYGQIWQRNYLVSRNIGSEELIRLIKSKSIVNLDQEAVYRAMSANEIDSIDANFLSSNFSIVKQEADAMEIIPIRNLAVMGAEEALKLRTDQLVRGFELSTFERAFGYGNRRFQLDSYVILLDCCSPSLIKYPRSNKSPEWHANQMIDSVSTGKFSYRANLVVSNCGEILHRNDQGETRFFF